MMVQLLGDQADHPSSFVVDGFDVDEIFGVVVVVLGVGSGLFLMECFLLLHRWNAVQIESKTGQPRQTMGLEQNRTLGRLV